MKEMSNLISQLEKGFQAINKKFFNGELEKATITVQRKKGTYGHCKVNKTWTDKCNEGKRREINIDTVGLGRTKAEIFTTLHHEMVHLYNLQNDIKDTSRNGYYHNEKFALSCVEHGLLKGVKDKKLGYFKPTAPTETRKFYNKLHLSNLNELGYIPKENGTTETPTTKATSYKYVCPECGAIARTTKVIRLGCLACAREMNIVEK